MIGSLFFDIIMQLKSYIVVKNFNSQTMKNTFLLILLIIALHSNSQVYTSTQTEEGKELVHKIFIDDHYLIHTVYANDPPQFIKTRGGYFKQDGDTYVVSLEFNSNFEIDSLKEITVEKTPDWKNVSLESQPLEGKWLMGGRVADDGTQNRRNTQGPRKTLKLLLDGHFQWTAYHTETMKFSGTGGGRYNAQEGIYSESIEYFSRDNSRVSMTLDFEYEQDGDDWFHKGYSSTGNPMHEIWVKRKNK